MAPGSPGTSGLRMPTSPPGAGRRSWSSSSKGTRRLRRRAGRSRSDWARNGGSPIGGGWVSRPPRDITRCLRVTRPTTSRGRASPSASRPPSTERACERRELQGLEEGHEVLLLRLGQLRLQDQVEERDRVVEREQAPVVQVGRRLLDAAQGE